MKTYSEAVRDRIPEIVEPSGKICVAQVLPPNEFEAKLNEKMGRRIGGVCSDGERPGTGRLGQGHVRDP